MFTKIFTAFRGAQNEIIETVIDNQALRILEQELRDAGDALRASHRELVSLVAGEIAAKRDLDNFARRIENRETQGQKAVAAGQEELAREVAVEIAALEEDRNRAQATLDGYRSHVTRMKAAIGRTESRIKEIRRELVRAKAVDSQQRAERVVGTGCRNGQSALAAAEATLARIQTLQQGHADKMAAARKLEEETDAATLDRKLRDARIIENERNIDDIMNRFRRNVSGNAPDGNTPNDDAAGNAN